MNRKTLRNPCQFEGVGIHSGLTNTLTLSPAPSGSGIVFTLNHQKVPAAVASLSHTNRATILKSGETYIQTPEHVLSACYGCGLTDVIIDVTSPEIPILDGSAAPFLEGIRQAGLEELPETVTPLVLQQPIRIEEGGASITAVPFDGLRITYTLEYPDSFIGTQTVTYDVSQDTYAADIAPARTYGFEAEVKALLERGLAKGGSLENALVIGEHDYLSPPRFPDECARHKILDIIGDLAVMGRPLCMHITAKKSGHHLNMQLAQALYSIDPFDNA